MTCVHTKVGELQVIRINFFECIPCPDIGIKICKLWESLVVVKENVVIPFLKGIVCFEK